MTIREFEKICISRVWITKDEHPDIDTDIKLELACDWKDYLSEEIMDSEIYLIQSLENNIIGVSIYKEETT